MVINDALAQAFLNIVTNKHRRTFACMAHLLNVYGMAYRRVLYTAYKYKATL